MAGREEFGERIVRRVRILRSGESEVSRPPPRADSAKVALRRTPGALSLSLAIAVLSGAAAATVREPSGVNVRERHGDAHADLPDRTRHLHGATCTAPAKTPPEPGTGICR